ncbi:Hsp70 family protein [Microbacterium sp. TWP3-1-2b2]|uniref:Hsp70 family protein n=1 Tax=Microbacterium sp. TWP3-1-2b2 TaxID=2804651 RepID=UPI003CE89C91
MSESEDVLALDLGTSRILAATAGLAPSEEIAADSFVLGHRSGGAAALVFVADDGSLLFGDDAEQRGFELPESLIRSFLPRVGDDVPMMAAGRAVTAAELTARLVVWARGLATQRLGVAPAIAIGHPSGWSGHRIAALREALSDAGIERVSLMPSAEAAAHHHDTTLALSGADPLRPGDAVAVYDLGGTSFEATILRKDVGDVFHILGEPVAIADVGGAAFDDAVLDHAIRLSGTDTGGWTDAEARIALARLRRASVAAKEALSFDADATIPLTLTAPGSTVRITRSELEAMIDPALERTLDGLERALDSARLGPEDLELILLTGGSANIPLVAQRLSERFDLPLVTAPAAAAALGAARLALLRGRAHHGLAAEAEPLAAETTGAEIDVATAPSSRSHRRRPFRGMLAGTSIRSATPVAVTVAAVVVAAGVVTTTAGAAILRDVAEDAAAPRTTAAAVDAFAADPFALLLDGSAGSQPVEPVAPAAPDPDPDVEPDPGDDSSGPREIVRDTLSEPRTPRVSAPESGSRRGPQPSTHSEPDPIAADPAPSGSTPSDPTPSDPTPSGPTPSGSTPSGPTPSDPTPSDPAPSDQTPSDPPPDPVPSGPDPAPTTAPDPAPPTEEPPAPSDVPIAES